MASLKRVIPTAARVLLAVSIGAALGVAGAAPFLTVYKYDDTGNIIRVSSTASDPDNCGSPGRPCSTSNIARACASGSCAAGTCAAGWGDCNGDKQVDGCETYLLTSNVHCGACGAACSWNHTVPSCSGGSCAAGVCEPNWGDCNGNKQTDGCETGLTTPTNCGGCGSSCSTNHIDRQCNGSSCELGTCHSGWGNCNGNKRSDGCETALTTPTNCGGCGVVCPSRPASTPTCTAALQCGFACTAGYADCNGIAGDGCETYVRSTTNCGGCGVRCATNSACVNGVCEVPDTCPKKYCKPPLVWDPDACACLL